jgi:hypothetical protein
MSKLNILQWTGDLPLKSITKLSRYGNRLCVGWLRNQGLIPSTKQEIFLQTGSGTQLVSYPMGTGALSRGVKWLGCEADLSLPSVLRFRMCGTTPPLPHASSWQDG